jgi:hypothetical protein
MVGAIECDGKIKERRHHRARSGYRTIFQTPPATFKGGQALLGVSSNDEMAADGPSDAVTWC